ncbi:MAG: alpha-L-fucosidase [Oscillospiraceae bacterium]|nr:alpha-L-fucosidase [Oscillospiraceae bacterium]
MPKMDEKTLAASKVVPSARQLAWQELEFYAFVHFGINTFTGSEWGSGGEDPALFHPGKLDCNQWAKAIRAAGMRGMILTAKHHDGFCLWPTETTKHSVAASPWKGGSGDVVREAAEACRAAGIRFGLYLSPWDRHEPTYGEGEAYNDFYKRQLRELLTNYGALFCLWFDGACGEGKNGRRQDYDWEGYYELVRALQPDAVIANRGPDVRWVGNEAGLSRSSEWSVVPWYMSRDDKIPKNISPSHWDLGSRKVARKTEHMIWYPAEADVSIRKGWFYHEKEDVTVKAPGQLVELYYKNVGRNTALLLNIPPNTEGLFAKRDVEALCTLGAQLRIDFREDLAEGSEVTDSCRLDDEHAGVNVLDPSKDRYWHTGPFGKNAELVIDLGDDYDINKVVLREHIRTGQQIEKFSLWIDENTAADGKSKWIRVCKDGTVIGHKRIVRFREQRIRRIKLVIEKTRGFAAIEKLECY